MIVKFTDNFLMIRGLITVLSALKMRNFTRIFPKKFRGAHVPPTTPFRKGGGAPPYGISQLRPCPPAEHEPGVSGTICIIFSIFHYTPGSAVNLKENGNWDEEKSLIIRAIILSVL